MKIDSRLVAADVYIEEIADNSNLSDDKVIQLKEVLAQVSVVLLCDLLPLAVSRDPVPHGRCLTALHLAQVYGARRGKVELEVKFWQLMTHLADLTDAVQLLRGTLRAVEAKSQEASLFLIEGKVKPSTLADVWTIKLTLDNPEVLRWTKNQARMTLHKLNSSLRYMCMSFAAECDLDGFTMPTCGNDFSCALNQAKTKITCCEESRARYPKTTKKAVYDVEIGQSAFVSRRQFISPANNTEIVSPSLNKIQVCLLHLGEWADWHHVLHVSVVLLGYESVSQKVSALITRNTGGSGGVAFPEFSWLFDYSTSTCQPLTQPADDTEDNIPPLRGCYTTEFTNGDNGNTINLAGVKAIRIVVKLEMERGPDEERYRTVAGGFQAVPDSSGEEINVYYGCAPTATPRPNKDVTAHHIDGDVMTHKEMDSVIWVYIGVGLSCIVVSSLVLCVWMLLKKAIHLVDFSMRGIRANVARDIVDVVEVGGVGGVEEVEEVEDQVVENVEVVVEVAKVVEEVAEVKEVKEVVEVVEEVVEVTEVAQVVEEVVREVVKEVVRKVVEEVVHEVVEEVVRESRGGSRPQVTNEDEYIQSKPLEVTSSLSS